MDKKKIPKESGEITRREFLKDAGLVVGGAALGSTVLLAACAPGETETVTETVEVVTTKVVPYSSIYGAPAIAGWPTIAAAPISPGEYEGLETTLGGVKMRTPFAVGDIANDGDPAAWGLKTIDEMVRLYLNWVDSGVGYLDLAKIRFVSEESRPILEQKCRPLEDWEATPAYKTLNKPFAKGYRLPIETPFGYMGGHGAGVAGLTGGPPSPAVRDKRLETWGKVIKKLKDHIPENVPLYMCIEGYGAPQPETFVDAAVAAEEMGVDMMEINLSCPLPPSYLNYPEYYIEKSYPLRFGYQCVVMQPDLMEPLIRAVVSKVNVPVGVKGNFEIGFPMCVDLARRYFKAGAKWWTVFNGVALGCAPDIYRGGKSPFPHNDLFTTGCGHGVFMLPRDRLITQEIRKHAPEMEVRSLGGITIPEHVVEMLMLGASATAQVNAVLDRGLSVMRENVHFMRKFLDEQGYNSVKDIIGISQQYLKGTEEVYGRDAVSYVGATDTAKCTGCALCCDFPTRMCRHLEGGKAVVDPDYCKGCGYCVVGCPYGACYLEETLL